MQNGHCLCGDISYTVHGEIRGASVCHCAQCRRQSGHLWASAHAKKDQVTITGPIAWYAASDTARRGFCPRCGSFLFWTAHAEDTISFSLGSLVQPTGLKLTKHIFVADKGDYYDIADGVAQKDT